MNYEAITMTPVIAPPKNQGVGFATGEVRDRYLKIAENLRNNKGQWFDLGTRRDSKVDYLVKILKGQGVEVTTRGRGNHQVQVYARYTGEIVVKTKRVRRSR